MCNGSRIPKVSDVIIVGLVAGFEIIAAGRHSRGVSDVIVEGLVTS